jgi:hypothetical protein
LVAYKNFRWASLLNGMAVVLPHYSVFRAIRSNLSSLISYAVAASVAAW